MKIRSLQLEHFRKFVDPVTITGLVDGINVLAECNEFGKSTLLAAIRGVLFERHMSKAAAVTSMQHWVNRTSPVIAMEFELASGLYKIEKRFLGKEPYARLTLPDGSIHHGEAAETQLQRALNFSQAGKTGSKAETTGIWAALWVSQSASASQAELSDSARQTIHGCLDQEVGALAGGARGKALLADVRLELAKIQNGNGKPSGRYKAAVEDLEQAKALLSELEDRKKRLHNDIQLLEKANRQRADAETAGEEARTDKLLAETRAKRDVAQSFEEQERTASANLSLCESRVGGAQRDETQRAHLKTQIEASSIAIETLTENEGAAVNILRDADLALAQQRQLIETLTADCDRATEKTRSARVVLELATTSSNLTAFRNRLQLAENAQERVNALTASLASQTISEDGLANLRALDKVLRQTQAVLEAQATQVSFELLAGANSRVTVDGQHPGDGPISIVEDAVIAIDGIGQIRVQPGIKDREALLARQSSQSRALRIALQSLSVETIDQAESELATHQSLKRQLEMAQMEVTTHTPADASRRLKAGAESLRNHASVLSASLEAGMAAAGISQLPELTSAQESLAEAVTEEAEATSKVAVARAPVADLEREQAQAVRNHAQAESKRKSEVVEQQKLTRELDRLLLQESPDALAERLSVANTALATQRELVANMQKNRPEETVAVLDGRIARYLQAKQNYATTRQELKQDIAILENRIEREEGVDIEEQVAACERSVSTLEASCQRYRREISVLELLLKSLEAAERAAKERYMEPIVRRITPYLQKLLSGASINCDDNFKITSIDRNLREEFDGLSGGTQEQIAVLTRLAFADMLVERGKPAMIILDDALVYSDPDRMERMFDLLTQAAERTQILILTCRREIFARLGAHHVKVVPRSV
jgi:DNA repair exonuclease SbcCD ATPase subunit